MGNIRVEIVKKLPLKWQITRFRSLHVRVLTSSPTCVCFQAAAHQRGSYPGWEGRLAPRPPTQTWRGVCTGQTAPAPPPTSTRSHLRSLSNRIPSHDPFSSVWQTFSPSVANDVAGSAFWGGAWWWGKPEANWTQPERHSSDPAPQPPDCNPQLCESDFLCSAVSLWPCFWTASAWCPAVALYTLLFPVLFSPCCLSRFFLLSCCFDFQSVLLSPPLALFFPLSLSKVKQADVSASPCLLPLFWVPVAIPPLSSPPSSSSPTPSHHHLPPPLHR